MNKPLTCGRYLAALRVTDHASWARAVRAALRETGSKTGAAARLGDPAWLRRHILDAEVEGPARPISRTTVFDWIREEPELVVGIDLREPGNPQWVRKNRVKT